MRVGHFFSCYKKRILGILLGAAFFIGNFGMEQNPGVHADEKRSETAAAARETAGNDVGQAFMETRQKAMANVLAAVSVLPHPKTVIREIEYQCETEYVEVDFLYQGEKKVVQKAKTGLKAVTERVVCQNGTELSREQISEKIIVEGWPEVIAIGTKERPAYIRPIEGGVTSSYFGPRWGEFHLGHDWAIPLGSEVMASKDGIVEEAQWNNSYGYYILIDHGNGYETRYAHLSEMLAAVGQTVKQGEVIARSGSTGNSTGPHLHFEVLRDGTQVEPLDFVKE